MGSPMWTIHLLYSDNVVVRDVLIETYRTPDDPARHKATPHYATWRDAVAPMMAEPRRSVTYRALQPDDAG